jgi:WD40 repeat protein
MTVSADEKTMLLHGMGRGAVQVWDLTKNEVALTLGGENEITSAASLSASGKYAVVGNIDLRPGNQGAKRKPADVVLYDARTGKELHRFETGAPFLNDVAVSADDKHVHATASQLLLRTWDRDSKKRLTDASARDLLPPMRGPRMLPLGQGRCLLASRSGAIVLWDAVRNEEVRRLVGHNISPIALALTPDSKRLVSISGRGTVRDKKEAVEGAELRLWDYEAGKTIGVLPLPALPVSVAVSKDGRRALVGDNRGTIYYIDLTRLKPPA